MIPTEDEDEMKMKIEIKIGHVYFWRKEEALEVMLMSIKWVLNVLKWELNG